MIDGVGKYFWLKKIPQQEVSVEFMKQRQWRLSFRRWLHEELQNQLKRLQDIVHWYNTNLENDKASWDLEKSGRFSVKSTYKHLSSNEFGDSFRKILKAKIPLKNKIFMWFFLQEAILTKDNICKRKWRGNESCAFCTDKESVRHIFFECATAIWSLMAFAFGSDCRPSNFDQYWVWISNSFPQGQQLYAMGLAAICWAIWRTRNSICFEQKIMKSPIEIVCMICLFLVYWAGLFKEEMEKQSIQGAEVLKKTALCFHKKICLLP